MFALFRNLCYGGDLKSRRLCIGAGGILNGSIRGNARCAYYAPFALSAFQKRTEALDSNNKILEIFRRGGNIDHGNNR